MNLRIPLLNSEIILPPWVLSPAWWVYTSTMISSKGNCEKEELPNLVQSCRRRGCQHSSKLLRIRCRRMVFPTIVEELVQKIYSPTCSFDHRPSSTIPSFLPESSVISLVPRAAMKQRGGADQWPCRLAFVHPRLLVKIKHAPVILLGVSYQNIAVGRDIIRVWTTLHFYKKGYWESSISFIVALSNNF